MASTLFASKSVPDSLIKVTGGSPVPFTGRELRRQAERRTKREQRAKRDDLQSAHGFRA